MPLNKGLMAVWALMLEKKMNSTFCQNYLRHVGGRHFGCGFWDLAVSILLIGLSIGRQS